MLIKLAEKDNLIHELDAKNRSLDDQLREGESTMRLVSLPEVDINSINCSL